MAEKREEFIFRNSKDSGVLGVLEGPVADIIHPTRNGRKYSESLWEKVFNSDIVKEMFQNGGIPGELDHPADRQEICSEKIAIMMPEPPKKGQDGLLRGIFKILDTPCGRIVYALAKAGFKIGVSSRGSGDTYIDSEGEECVDEDTYDFQCFDCVILPAVKSARMNLVTESLDTTKKTLKESLDEVFSKSSEADKSLMTETLEHLDIEYKNDHPSLKEDVNIDADPKTIAADDNGASMLNDLQESLQQNKELEAKIKVLQEQLSVCYAKETSMQNKIDTYKTSITALTRSCKASKLIAEELENTKKTLADYEQQLDEKDSVINHLTKKSNLLKSSRKSLEENLASKDAEVQELRKRFSARISELKSDNDKLTEQLNSASTKNNSLTENYDNKVNKLNKLVETYKKVANDSVNRYIESEARKLGVSKAEIKNRLSENYTFDDIDSVCEELQSYKLRMNNLPFSIDSNKKPRVVVNESRCTKPANNNNVDDEVDSDLAQLAGLI